MIYEVRSSDFRFKCKDCKYFDTEDGLYGYCTCTTNGRVNRTRSYNSKACNSKEFRKEEK